MDKQHVVYEKTTECMRTIFAFCISRTSSREEAEDLSQEIVKEVLNSAKSLRNEESFYGWMWAIANNIYKGYLRKRKKTEHSDLDENLEDSLSKTLEAELVQNEELNILRRELSLLSEHYRKATIMYYIEDKSCKHISQELEISLEMVKYLLFKSRKILKEGMNMIREYGEKSYNPGVFNIDVWMDEMDYKLYYELFDRRLPGNILLAAYYNPMTLGELSMELGVSVAYLEDEIQNLMKHNLIKQLQNARYQTNIIIFTKSCLEDIYANTEEYYASAADNLYDFIVKNEAKIRGINFKGCDYSKNRIYWFAAHVALLTALHLVEEEMKSTEPFPLLSNGTHGYIWGRNSAKGEDLFNGIYGLDDEIDDIAICNFKIIEKCQQFHPREKKVNMLLQAAKNEIKENDSEVFLDLIRDGYINKDNGGYSVNFPVLTEKQLNEFIDLMIPIIIEMKKDIKLVVTKATKILENHAPSQLLDICPVLSQIKCRNNAIGYIVEQMCNKGYLFVPDSLDKLCMYAVLK